MASAESQSKSQQAYYDRHFSGYKSYKLENWRVSYIERIFGAFGMLGKKLKPSFSYLDVGVGGSGYTVVEAARQGATAWGVDLSEVAVATAQRLSKEALPPAAAKRCRFRLCSAERLPFKSNSFDRVSSIAVLEHVVNDGHAMGEIARVLKKGGLCLVAVPHAFSRMPILLVPVIWAIDKMVGHLRHYSEEGLEAAMAKHGLKKTGVIYHMHMSKFWQAGLQTLFKGMNERHSRLWWRLERMDNEARDDSNSAMISMVFEKER